MSTSSNAAHIVSCWPSRAGTANSISSNMNGTPTRLRPAWLLFPIRWCWGSGGRTSASQETELEADDGRLIFDHPMQQLRKGFAVRMVDGSAGLIVDSPPLALHPVGPREILGSGNALVKWMLERQVASE